MGRDMVAATCELPSTSAASSSVARSTSSLRDHVVELGGLLELAAGRCASRSPISPGSRSRARAAAARARERRRVDEERDAPGTLACTRSAPSVSSSSSRPGPSSRIRSISERERPVAVPGDVGRRARGTRRRRPGARTPRRSRNQYSRPSSSPGRCARVVAETATSSSGSRVEQPLISVPLPAPDGPVTTKTGSGRATQRLKSADQLGALALGEPADRLRLADPALVEAARRLDAAELRHRHQHVEDLRRRDVLGRLEQDLLDLHAPALRSFFSCARLTRMSFARFSASIRWSSERSGACAWVFDDTMSAGYYQPRRCGQASRFLPVSRHFSLPVAKTGIAHLQGRLGANACDSRTSRCHDRQLRRRARRGRAPARPGRRRARCRARRRSRRPRPTRARRARCGRRPCRRSGSSTAVAQA